MIQSILVPLDGSRFAEVALPVALRLARSGGGRLKLLLVHEPAMALVPVADVPMPLPPEDPELRAQQQTYLAETASRVEPTNRVRVSQQLVDGVAAPAIVEAISLDPPDLVVMATHGRGPLSRFWLGSVADYVLRHVSVPILLLRPKNGGELPPPAIPLTRFLVPLDLSEESATILEPVKALATLTQAHLTLLYVAEPVLGVSEPALPYPMPVDTEILEARKADAQRYLDQQADRLRAEGFQVATRVVMGVGPATMILAQEQRERFDLVALSTHGWGGLKRFLVGSVADKVIRGSERPVLVFRPAAAG